MYLADLHIHSKYSMATSRDCDAPHLDLSGADKGIGLIGTGDFTHPAWRETLRESLEPSGAEGLYRLKPELRLPRTAPGAAAPLFVVTGEISSIYKRGGKTRKVHNLILLPSLEAADALALRLEKVGNIHSDGRPILGLDSRDLLEIAMTACPEAIFVPAHIWTPHFSLFGAFSGFETLEECFGDLSPYLHALETGLSSDPPMNRRVSALDGYTLISNSDAHSPAKLGREANIIEGTPSYPGLKRALETGKGFLGTLEFFPEEGKYHLDGHRACGVCLTPEETMALHGRCPVCGKKLTIGVEHRVCELADRPLGALPGWSPPFESLAPLREVVAAAGGFAPASVKAGALYEKLLREAGPEFSLLRETPVEEISRIAGPLTGEGIRRLRAGQVTRIPGYDGEFGKILLFAPGEREALLGQTALFAIPLPEKKTGGERPARPKGEPPIPAVPEEGRREEATAAPGCNLEQEAAVRTEARALAVIAGPGTGKTKTLVERIAFLIRERGAKPGEITAVTFTNQAAGEMTRRLTERLGKRKAAGIHIGTFHALCVGLLDKKPILGEDVLLPILGELLRERGSRLSPREALAEISRMKNGAPSGETTLPEGLWEAYGAGLRAMGARDLDDLLLDALNLTEFDRTPFTHLLVDEYQDINALQRRLTLHWGAGNKSLLVIGDPDQSIYGFRGASAECFLELAKAYPALETVRLTRNYRSAPAVLEAALQVIGHNPGEAREQLPVRPEGRAVRLIKAQSALSEGVFVAKEIARLAGGTDMLSASEGERGLLAARPFSEMAVLCRTHRQLRGIEECLLHDGIPCVISGKGDVLEDPAVERALGVFRAALQWGEKTPSGERDALMAEFLPLISGEKPKRLLERYRAIAEDSEALERLTEMAAGWSGMGAFLNELTLGRESDIRRAAGKGDPSGGVRLMTLHGSKGLEFPVVFLTGLEKGSLPLEREGLETDLEEERRLLYVGMTRARDELVIIGGYPPSVFLGELPESVRRDAALAAPFRQERQLRLF